MQGGDDRALVGLGTFCCAGLRSCACCISGVVKGRSSVCLDEHGGCAMAATAVGGQLPHFNTERRGAVPHVRGAHTQEAPS